eukprot:11667443-Alexandrium_andersonii.AAC.1
MSASLVGSEMCIRDSSIWMTRSPSMPRRAKCPCPGLGIGRKRGPLQLPVSYTHLTLPTICSV